MLKGDSAHQDKASDNEVQERSSANAEYEPAKMNYPKPRPDPRRIRQEHLQKRRHKHCSPIEAGIRHQEDGTSVLRRWRLRVSPKNACRNLLLRCSTQVSATNLPK